MIVYWHNLHVNVLTAVFKGLRLTAGHRPGRVEKAVFFCGSVHVEGHAIGLVEAIQGHFGGMLGICSGHVGAMLDHVGPGCGHVGAMLEPCGS